MDDLRGLLQRVAGYASDHLEGLVERPVTPTATHEQLHAALGGPLPEQPTDPEQVVERLVAGSRDGLIGSAGGRFFGFVIGGGVPAAVAADWLTAAWDQNAGLYVAGPAAAVVEEVAGAWLKELLGLPATASFGFVTGCQMAHVTCLAAARHALLARAGWDVERDGLTGAPAVRVVVGEQRHVTVDRALRLLGLGAGTATVVPCDGQGRMRADKLPAALVDDGTPTIVVTQLGDVNTGAFDPIDEIVPLARRVGAWVHVDGAFGLWAAVPPATRHLVAGHETADSWASDAHKWLNVPYDSGLAFVADPAAHRGAFGARASYLEQADGDGPRDQLDWTPEFSRRARGFAVWAAIASLGRDGIAELVERCCAHARRFAAELGGDDGVEILSEVVLNQVLLRFGDDERTRRVVGEVQRDGTCWLSGTTWQGRAAMRISVSNWSTSDTDVGRAIDAIRRAHAAVAA